MKTDVNSSNQDVNHDSTDYLNKTIQPTGFENETLVKKEPKTLTLTQVEAINKLTDLRNMYVNAVTAGEITNQEFFAMTEGALRSEHPHLWEALESLKGDLNSDQR